MWDARAAQRRPRLSFVAVSVIGSTVVVGVIVVPEWRRRWVRRGSGRRGRRRRRRRLRRRRRSHGARRRRSMVLGGGGVMVLGGGGVMVLGGGGVMVLGGGGVMVLGGGAVRDDAGCRAALPTLVDAGDVVTTTTTAMIASTAVDRIVNRRRVRLIVVPFGVFPRLRARAQRRRTASAPPRISRRAPADSMTSAGVAHGASSLSMKPKKPRVALSANAAMLASR